MYSNTVNCEKELRAVIRTAYTTLLAVEFWFSVIQLGT